MHGDQHVVFDALLPELVELRQGERARPAETGHRSGTDQDGAGTALDHPVQLLDGVLDDGQGDDRSCEDAVLVVEPPHLVEPLVQGVHDDVDRDRVVAQPLLDQAGQSREHQRAVQAELVHQLQTGSGLKERRNRPHRFAEQLAAALAVGIAVLEVLLPRARFRDHREGGVGNVVADLAAQRNLGAAVDLHVLDDVLVLLGQVLGQRLFRLVEMVVRVKERKRYIDLGRKRRHGTLPFLLRESYSHLRWVAMSCRTRNFCTLPLAVRGKSSTWCSSSGHFWAATPAALKWPLTSSSVGIDSPARSRNTAAVRSPRRASGAATTTASATAGMASSTSSTSRALMFSPPRMMTSALRSVMVRYPSSSSTPTSPVWYQPSSSKALAVSSGSV